MVSVIMPVYNAEQFLEEAIRSTFNQIYSSFELICVDDCSTDSSYSILKRLSLEDDRLTVYQKGNI